MSVRTRIAPSPTGQMHIGTVRTALFNFLFAKKHGGEFFVRIEDTDKERNKPEWTDAIWEDFAWCGLEPDAKYVQSEHIDTHKKYLAQLIESDDAYLSKEEAKDGSGRQVEVVRLRNPGKSVTFNDLIRGNVTFDTTELGDFVIARSIDDPLYHFAVVVDDHEADITHVIRAEEHLSNTPRQILIQEALEFTRPLYAHIPLILAPDGSKLSKRKHGASTSIEHYREEGFLPEAVLNYLALLGWNPGDDREDFSLAELIEAFDLSRVQKSGAIFDLVKFKSVNQRWMRKLSDDDFIKAGNLEASDAGILHKIVPLLKDRAHTFKEAQTMLRDELDFMFASPKLDKELVTAKEPEGGGATKEHLNSVVSILNGIPGSPEIEDVKSALMAYADAVPKEAGGRGAVLWPLRYALSGKERSPDPFTIISILGTTESVFRIENALGIL